MKEIGASPAPIVVGAPRSAEYVHPDAPIAAWTWDWSTERVSPAKYAMVPTSSCWYATFDAVTAPAEKPPIATLPGSMPYWSACWRIQRIDASASRWAAMMSDSQVAFRASQVGLPGFTLSCTH